MEPTTCTLCYALTYNLEQHAGYHTAVANADPMPLPDTIPATVD